MYTPIDTRSLPSVSPLTQPAPGKSAQESLSAIARSYLAQSLAVPMAGASEVAQVLMGAGMAPAAASTYAETISAEEAKSTQFLEVVRDKLSQGLLAGDAILWARFSTLASEDELSDPQFIQDLKDANAKGYGASATQTLQYAQANGLALRLGIPSSQTLSLSLDQLNNFLALDASVLKAPLSVGHSLNELADIPPENLATLQQLSPTLLQWLGQTTQASLADMAKLSEEEITSLQSAMDNGSRLATHDEAFNDILPETVSHPIKLGSEWLVFETQSGQKIIVSQNTNPGLYNQALGILTERTKLQVDAARIQAGLPPQTDVNVMERATQQLKDEADPNFGFASVNESVTKKLLDKYRGMLERNEITKDDPRAQLIRTFEARTALAAGYQLLPYYEADGGFSGTYRTYPGGPDNPIYQPMSSADVRNLINEGEVNNRVLSLMSNETIQADYQTALNEEINALPNKQALIDTLFNNLSSPNYIEALRTLKDQGLSYEAEQMTQRDLMSLTMLDPTKSTEAAQQLRLNSVAADFQELADNPALIEIETFESALYDSANITIQTIRRFAALIRHGTQTAEDVNKYINEILQGKKSPDDLIKFVKGSFEDKKLVNELSKVMRQLVIDANTKGSTNVAGINQAQFKEAMAKVNVPLKMQGPAAKFFATAQKYGVWGSIGAGACVASFGYKLSKGAWGDNSTPLDRWGAARDAIGFFSSIGHVAKSGTKITDFFRDKLLGNDTNSKLTWKMLGLDLTLPEVWGKDSFLPGGQSWGELVSGRPGPESQKLFDTPSDSAGDRAARLQSYVDAIDEMWAGRDNAASNPGGLFADATDASRPALKEAAAKLGQQWVENTPTPAALAKAPGTVARVTASAIKILHATLDLAGVGDIVVGALSLKDAIKAGDEGMMAASSLGIIGGVALTAAGGISTAALVAALPAAVAASAAPLFLVGAAFAAAGFMAAAISTSVTRHNDLQGSSDRQGEWFQDLANDGLAYSDWADKLEFLRNSFAWYGNDNTDNTDNNTETQRSYFDFQKSEWEYFQRTQGNNGSSLNRLNDQLHIHTEKTWPDPLAQEVNSQTYF